MYLDHSASNTFSGKSVCSADLDPESFRYHGITPAVFTTSHIYILSCIPDTLTL